MDIYDFINSNDIKNYLRERKYKLSLIEKVYLINHSFYVELDDRLKFLKKLLKDKDEEKDEKADEEIVNFFKEKIGDRVQKYSVESLKKEDTPAVILISEESRRMMEMQSRFAGLDYGFDLKEEKTLVINDRNPLIKKVLSLRDDETKKEAVDVICNQIVDLALLANKELGAEELDLFIKRSNELMSKVISL